MRRKAWDAGTGTFTRVRAVLASALLIGVAAVATSAAWSDSEFAASDLAAGTFSLVSRTDTGAFTSHGSGSPATLDWPLAPLFPGESVAGWVQVQSAGSVTGDVLLSGVTLAESVPGGSPAQALRDSLRVRVSATVSADPTPPACTTSTPGVEVTGLNQIPVVPAEQLEADGANTVTFCVVVTLPIDAPAAAQGATLTPTWNFTGSTR